MDAKKYIIGIGCRRGTTCAEIDQAVKSVLEEHNISITEISLIVSCDLKAYETGLLEFSEKFGLPIRFFTTEELATVSVPNPSAKVEEKIGSSSVCEAAAKFAGNGILVAEKQKLGKVTVALGEKKIEFPK